MFMVLAVLLIAAWFLGLNVFHVGSGLIHLLLILAIASLLWQVIAGRRVKL